MKQWLVLVAVLMLAGCSATPYKQGEGYWDDQIGEATFKVRSWVNGFSAASRADNFVLMRAADIACINGYRYFELLEKHQGGNNQITTSSATILLQKDQGAYDAKYIFKNLYPKYKAVPSCSYSD